METETPRVHHSRMRDMDGRWGLVSSMLDPYIATSVDVSAMMEANPDVDVEMLWSHAERQNARDLEAVIESGEVWSPQHGKMMPLEELKQ